MASHPRLHIGFTANPHQVSSPGLEFFSSSSPFYFFPCALKFLAVFPPDCTISKALSPNPLLAASINHFFISKLGVLPSRPPARAPSPSPCFH